MAQPVTLLRKRRVQGVFREAHYLIFKLFNFQINSQPPTFSLLRREFFESAPADAR